jgi:hypothetical protein
MPWINAFASILGGIISIGFMWIVGKYGLVYFAWANWGFTIVLLIPVMVMKKIGFRIFYETQNIISRPFGAYIALVIVFMIFEDHLNPWLWAGLSIILYGLLLFYEYYPLIKRFINKAPDFKNILRLQNQIEKS